MSDAVNVSCSEIVFNGKVMKQDVSLYFGQSLFSQYAAVSPCSHGNYALLQQPIELQDKVFRNFVTLHDINFCHIGFYVKVQFKFPFNMLSI